ncbi:hypothetical protein MPC4_90116 [Methylocella tundrae]|uniref:Uncharacterized protein n=1 Tax=Methylocella tundrae TaxID=227605 RepID=A0A8B6MCU3_METTU|nr:hypothetical protein [Methylocella tundrae]VTZ52641.1 hypothetical protein MPC4_90116 [Methylocella tundrae]
MSEGFLSIDNYSRVTEIIQGAFHVDYLLPQYVFKKNYKFTLLREFGLGSNLMEIIHDGRFCSQTDIILLSVLDPNPISYFYKHFGKINSFRFGANITDEEYSTLVQLSPGNDADALLYHGDTVVWIPEHADWAIWGQRDPEITVIGFDDPALADFLLNDVGYWFDAETALKVFAGMPYRSNGYKAPEDFARPLIENYGSRKDLERKLDEAGIRLKPGIWADEAE